MKSYTSCNLHYSSPSGKLRKRMEILMFFVFRQKTSVDLEEREREATIQTWREKTNPSHNRMQ